MISILIVVAVLLASVYVAATKGARTSFCWVYWPVLAAVPQELVLELPVLPDLNCPRMAMLGLVVTMKLRNDFRDAPQRRFWDALPWLMVLSFSISFGMRTEFMGFVHLLTKLTLDWGLPYYVTRVLIRDARGLRAMLVPAVAITTAVGLSALYEMRMASRPFELAWSALGVEVSRLTYAEHWRGGFLRAHAHFGHPLTMATFFMCMLPWVALLRWANPRSLIARHALVRPACGACIALGVVSSLSRGPIAVMLLVVTLFTLARRWPVAVVWSGILAACILAVPTWDVFSELVKVTEQGLVQEGNVESSYYRLALLMLYGTRLADFGWWGDPSLVGVDYEAAWSIDNAYLYQFIEGGMLGGGLFVVFTLAVIGIGYHRMIRAAGQARLVACCLVASFTGISLCLANVWFSPDVAPFYWIGSALVFNLPSVGMARQQALANCADGPVVARRGLLRPRRVRTRDQVAQQER